jgi:hypothetical protein
VTVMHTCAGKNDQLCQASATLHRHCSLLDLHHKPIERSRKIVTLVTGLQYSTAVAHVTRDKADFALTTLGGLKRRR